MLKIGLIREGKNPPDSRVALSPVQCREIEEQYSVKIFVEPSVTRCFSDEEYSFENIEVADVMDECDVLLGVKEVPIPQLIPNKMYFFFSHTIKEQSYNRDLLRSILEKNIHLVDYEVLTNDSGKRVIAFGYFAGVVGAHNGIMAYGKRTGLFELKRMRECRDYQEARAVYNTIDFPPMSVVLTGTGRVATGAAKVLMDMGFHKVSPIDYLHKKYARPVFTQLGAIDYIVTSEGKPFDKKAFYHDPTKGFKMNFEAFYQSSDVMINGIYWDNRAPAFFTREEMHRPDFKIQVIADVTCDIAPVASIPSTLRASTIDEPVFGYDPKSGKEAEPYLEGNIDMMTVDNLPNELPRDASVAFGNQFMNYVVEPLLNGLHDPMIERATVAINGQLGKHFGYLSNYVGVQT